MKRILSLILILASCGRGFAQDVDTRIPLNKVVDDHTFVLVISNENYKHEEHVPYALNDGETFAIYCEKALGIPAKNIHRAADATLNDMNHELQWLGSVMQAYGGEARAIFYYSGHGMPDEQTKDALLLPTDGYASDAASGLSTRRLYATLGDMPSRQTLVFLDACFSGAKRDGTMLASSRGVAIKATTPPVKNGMVVFSAAQGGETAYPYKEKQHGMFTYYLLEKLQASGGAATLGEMSDYVGTQVSRNSLVENGKSQTPTVMAQGEDWRKWRFAEKPAREFETRKSDEKREAGNESKGGASNTPAPVAEPEKPYQKKNLSTTPVAMPDYKIEGAGTGVQGTYLVKVTVKAKKANDVTEDELMRGALHGVLFRGFSGQQVRQHQRPLAGSATVEQQYADFFNDFFTADFRNYANVEGDTRMVMKVGKEFQVSSLVSVQKDQLRRYLESQGVIKRLTNGF